MNADAALAPLRGSRCLAITLARHVTLAARVIARPLGLFRCDEDHEQEPGIEVDRERVPH